MNSSSQKHKLNRFTTLPVLLDMVAKDHLVFSSPKFWDDENDTELLEIYRKKKNAKTLLALCFLKDHETIHHWKAFAGGTNGCCIEFDKAMLIKLLSNDESGGLRFGSVIYKKIKDSEDGAIDDCEEMIPFKKRWPYRFEKEFRAIWFGEKDFYAIPNINFKTLITRITISQLMPRPKFRAFRECLKKSGIRIPINHSTTYRNKKWIEKFRIKFGDNS
jgi:DUF2971 family protein